MISFIVESTPPETSIYLYEKVRLVQHLERPRALPLPRAPKAGRGCPQPVNMPIASKRARAYARVAEGCTSPHKQGSSPSAPRSVEGNGVADVHAWLPWCFLCLTRSTQ